MNEMYMRAYMEGYTAALKLEREEKGKPYIDKHALIERYDGKIGLSKAMEIIRCVRHACGGGKLDCAGLVLRSELEYWENTITPEYKELLLCGRRSV